MHRIRIVIALMSGIFLQTFFYLVVDHWLFVAKMGEWLQLSPTSLLVISFAANRLHAWRLSSLKENLLILKAGSIHTRWIFVRLRNVRFPFISSTFCSQKIERARLI